MSPVISEIQTTAYEPYVNEQITQEEFVDRAEVPLKEFMLRNTEQSSLKLFCDLAGQSVPEDQEGAMALPLRIVVPSFMTTELKRAFEIGFYLYIPFLLIDVVVRLLLELCVGVILAFVMQLFFSVVQLGGEVIDAQMGLNMAQVYDSSSQVNMTVTTSLLNVLLVLTFFAENGHYTLLRIFLSSGSVVPYGTVSLGSAVVSGVVEVFAACMVLAVKLALPILAAELLGELGMGILMKAIPQINAFVINMELKIIIGLVLLLAFLTPINEFLLDVEKNMLDTLGGMLQVIAGAG